MKRATYLAADAVRERVSVGYSEGRLLCDNCFVMENVQGQGVGVLRVNQGVAQQLSQLDRGHDCRTSHEVGVDVAVRTRD